MVVAENVLIEAVEGLLTQSVNGFLREEDGALPLFEIERGRRLGGVGIVPLVGVSGCELTEKERVLRIAAFSVDVEFGVQGLRDGRLVYLYRAALSLALRDDFTLGGIADRADLVRCKFEKPEKAGGVWKVFFRLRVVSEELIGCPVGGGA